MNRKDDCEIINSAVEEQFNEFHFKKQRIHLNGNGSPHHFKLYNVPIIKKYYWNVNIN